jgi:hypothetical protein
VPAALLGLLSAAAEDGPLLCLVDDVQWLDAPSVEAIVFAARRLQNEGIAMLLAARDAVAGGTGAGRQVDAAGVERLALGALDDPPPPSSCAARTAPGCPARSPPTWSTPPPATRSRCSSCRARSAATSWPGARRCRPSCRPACRSTRPSAGSSRAVGGRAHRPARRRCRGRGEDVTHLAAALGRLGVSERALDDAEAAGVVVLEGPHVRFRHTLLRAATYHAAPPPERRAAHRALAESAPEGAASRAWHLAAAITAADETVARDLEDAANDARRRGGHGSAARAFARAAELTPTRASAPAGCSRRRSTTSPPARSSRPRPTPTSAAARRRPARAHGPAAHPRARAHPLGAPARRRRRDDPGRRRGRGRPAAARRGDAARGGARAAC